MAISLAYPSAEEGGNLLVQMISVVGFATPLCDEMFCFEIKILFHRYVAIQPYPCIYCQPLGSNEETERHISTCRHGLRGRREGVGTLWCYLDMREESVAQPLPLTRPLHQAGNVCHVQEGRNLVITTGCGVVK